MSGMMQKRLALLIITVVLILAVIPAYYPVDDETARQDCPFCNTYDQLFTATTAYYNPYHDFRPIEAAVPPEITSPTPKTLPSTKESRAPPA